MQQPRNPFINVPPLPTYNQTFFNGNAMLQQQQQQQQQQPFQQQLFQQPFTYQKPKTMAQQIQQMKKDMTNLASIEMGFTYTQWKNMQRLPPTLPAKKKTDKKDNKTQLNKKRMYYVSQQNGSWKRKDKDARFQNATNMAKEIYRYESQKQLLFGGNDSEKILYADTEKTPSAEALPVNNQALLSPVQVNPMFLEQDQWSQQDNLGKNAIQSQNTMPSQSQELMRAREKARQILAQMTPLNSPVNSPLNSPVNSPVNSSVNNPSLQVQNNLFQSSFVEPYQDPMTLEQAKQIRAKSYEPVEFGGPTPLEKKRAEAILLSHKLMNSGDRFSRSLGKPKKT